MACFKRMINSGIRLYQKPATLNRRGAYAFCSSSGDGRSVFSDVKRSYNFDTFALVNALKAEGVPLKNAEAVSCSMAEVLAELEKHHTQPSNMLQTKFESLRKNIKEMSRESAKDTAAGVDDPDLLSERRRLVKELANEATAARLLYKEARALEEAKGKWKSDIAATLGLFGIFGLWLSKW